MLARIKTRALWTAIGITLGGGALALAAPLDVPTSPPELEIPHSGAPPVTTPASTGASEDGDTPKPEKAEKAEKAKAAKAQRARNAEGRKMNHGFYVSQAAHCQDVSEGETSFTAPEDCETNGEAKGAYVSSVAESDLGKKPKPENGE